MPWLKRSICLLAEAVREGKKKKQAFVLNKIKPVMIFNLNPLHGVLWELILPIDLEYWP